MRFLVIVFILFTGILPEQGARAAPLERGTAITDPLALRELDHGRFGLGRLIMPEGSADIALASRRLFALPSMAGLRRAIDGEFDRYIARHKAKWPDETIGVGAPFDVQLFDRALLDSPETRFVLVGIVNRIDRAYVDPTGCGEIRLIYRLRRINAASTGDNTIPPRLPMTLNLVLRAKGDDAAGRQGAPMRCSALARRWLAAGEWPLTETELAGKLLAQDGPLASVRPENIDRIETNLQIAHAPKSAIRDFHTDYLLKVFRYNKQAAAFEEAPMENQIDRDRIVADDSLKRDFKSWLLDLDHLAAFDRGIALIPERFLASGAIVTTPAGFDATDLQPAFGLVQGVGAANAPVFNEADIVAALRKAAANGVALQNIRSIGGFDRRLNDITCSGCHQTRGIGGFHFPGVDWMAAKPSNSTVVPASPHFFGDQIRRRDILVALRDGKRPDYSRGFSSRPQLRGNTELAGTDYSDGWGAHCYRRGGTNDDASFRSWTCAKGLACQIAGHAPGMGMCFVESHSPIPRKSPSD